MLGHNGLVQDRVAGMEAKTVCRKHLEILHAIFFQVDIQHGFRDLVSRMQLLEIDLREAKREGMTQTDQVPLSIDDLTPVPDISTSVARSIRMGRKISDVLSTPTF